MSENLHPKYIYDWPSGSTSSTDIHSEEEYGTYSQEGRAVITLLNSGLCVLGTRTSQYTGGSFNFDTFVISGFQSNGWGSPVPKTYSFLNDNNEVIYNIPYSSFTYNSDWKIWKASIGTIPSNIGEVTKLIVVDPMLWEYKSIYVSGHAGIPDSNLFPLYKKNGESMYHWNEALLMLPAGTYSFLTSIGALYQTQSTDLLRKYYPTDIWQVIDTN